MNENEYLRSVIEAHQLDETSDEAVAAMTVKNEVERLIRSKLSSAVPVIEIAGSYAKGTMIRDHYDLDVVCYFQNDETEAGETPSSPSFGKISTARSFAGSPTPPPSVYCSTSTDVRSA